MTHRTWLAALLLCAPLSLFGLASTGNAEPAEPSSVINAQRITIRVTVDAKRPDGEPWDPDGERPDPYLKVDGKSYRSEGCRETYECSLSIETDATTLNLEVYDADLVVDELIGSGRCSVPTRTACRVGASSVQIIGPGGGLP